MERYNNLSIPESVAPIGNMIDLDPVGMQHLGEALVRSHRKAIILVHPLFAEEQYDLWKQAASAKTPFDAYQAHLKQQLFDTYAHEIVRLTQSAQRAGVPVIVFAEHWRHSNRMEYGERKMEARNILQESMRQYGYTDADPLYYVITQSYAARPLDEYVTTYDPSEAAEVIFAKKLRDVGLQYAVIAGSFFGGKNFTDSFPLMYIKRDRTQYFVHKKLSERRNPGSSFIHPLEILDSSGCVLGTMQAFATAGIQFRLARPGTYPQIMPTWSEIEIHHNTAISHANDYYERYRDAWIQSFQE